MRRNWLLGFLAVIGCTESPTTTQGTQTPDPTSEQLFIDEGKQVFRHDTFGSEQFFGGTLGLHRVIAGAANGGEGDGISPTTALSLGLKVDATALPGEVTTALAAGQVDLEDPATTLVLLKSNAVVGLRGFFDDAGALTSLGTTCALCHSTVDDSFAPGIGNRLDGWPNRDLNAGAILASSADVSFFADALQVSEADVRNVFNSWGPGRYDALLVLDGKAQRPDGTTSSVLLPAAFGLAGVNLATYTGFGDVTYWNAYVANTQMHGIGTFIDPRLDDPAKYPVAARLGLFDIRTPRADDQITSKLPALHLYQLSLRAPKPPGDSFDATASARGREVFDGKARCASCHVPPIFTEPGHNLHTPAEIGIDDFQASRSPTGMYRTTPLGGLFTRSKGGFYHDGRFADLAAVVEHYDSTLSLGLSEGERSDLVEYLRSL